MTDPEGKPLPGGIVRLYNENTLLDIAVGINDRTGIYKSPILPCPASYTISVDRPGSAPYSRTKQPLDVSTTMDIVLFPDTPWWLTPWPEPVIAVVLTGMFFISLIFFRWHNIARLDQSQLQAEVEMTRARLKIESDPDPAKRAQVLALDDELTAAYAPFVKGRKGVTTEGKEEGKHGSALQRMDVLFWTRGQEIGSWMRVREVQRLLIQLWPPHSTERLRAALQTAQQALGSDTSPMGAGFGQLVRDALSVPTPDDKEEERWKELLLEVTDYINSSREESYTAITIWQSKAAWLAIAACVLIVATVAARGGGMLFIAGAVGGYMSRLARALKATDIPTDYGASWNTLFLSPLLGSLAGFFGVMMIQGLGTGGALSLALVGSPLVLPALAFLLGFSERLFDSLVDALDKEPAAAQPAASAPAPSPQPAPTTSVRDVQPMPALQGELVVVTGKGLEPNRVDGVALTAQDKTAVKIENVVQEAEQIRFNLPQTLADGSYILAIKVKDSPFITKTVRVDQLPVINDVQPNPLKAAALITITGQELDAEVKVELHDTNGNAVSLSDLTQSPTSITFTAPPAGTYGLVLRLGTRNPVDRQLVVTA